MPSLCIFTYFFSSSFLFAFYILCALTCMCHGKYVVIEGSYWESILSSHCVSPGDQTHVIRLGLKSISFLHHLVDPLPFFFSCLTCLYLTSLLCKWVIAGHNFKKQHTGLKEGLLYWVNRYTNRVQKTTVTQTKACPFSAELDRDRWCSDNRLCNFTLCFSRVIQRTLECARKKFGSEKN